VKQKSAPTVTNEILFGLINALVPDEPRPIHPTERGGRWGILV